jgi:hypothetical protein
VKLNRNLTNITYVLDFHVCKQGGQLNENGPGYILDYGLCMYSVTNSSGHRVCRPTQRRTGQSNKIGTVGQNGVGPGWPDEFVKKSPKM